MACYLEAVRFNAEGARLLLSRILQMLLIDEESAAKVRRGWMCVCVRARVCDGLFLSMV